MFTNLFRALLQGFSAASNEGWDCLVKSCVQQERYHECRFIGLPPIFSTPAFVPLRLLPSRVSSHWSFLNRHLNCFCVNIGLPAFQQRLVISLYLFKFSTLYWVLQRFLENAGRGEPRVRMTILLRRRKIKVKLFVAPYCYLIHVIHL